MIDSCMIFDMDILHEHLRTDILSYVDAAI